MALAMNLEWHDCRRLDGAGEWLVLPGLRDRKRVIFASFASRTWSRDIWKPSRSLSAPSSQKTVWEHGFGQGKKASRDGPGSGLAACTLQIVMVSVTWMFQHWVN